MLDANGTVTQVVEVWRDISDRRAAEARLSESHRLASLGMLASGFSHELNTPLATVLTCVEGILRESAPAGEAGETSPITQRASTAREQVLRCRGITQHFLRLSRGQASHPEIVNVETTVSEVVRLIEPTARAHSVRVAQEPLFAGVHVRTDDAELQHVLINLVLNAIQASAPGSEVRVQVVGGDPVRIRVIDHGCGISTDDQRRIFEPFVSLRQGGTGLGLFLSWQFARRWGGDITVTSQPGAGAIFDVIIPAVSPVAAQRSA
jgi:signal transduction histidine kinase